MQGPATAPGLNGATFGLAANGGHLALTLWLILSGARLRSTRSPSGQATRAA